MKNQKTNMLLKGIIPDNLPKVGKMAVVATFTAGMMTGCSADADYSDMNLPPEPQSESCSDWDWDGDLKVWKCDDYDGDYSDVIGYEEDDDSTRTVFFHNGFLYAGQNQLVSSTGYKSYKSSSSFKSYGTQKASVSSGSKSGVGGKSSGFGG